MAIKGILFDKDGTLFDFEATFGPATAGVIAELARGNETVATEMAARAGFDLDRLRFAGDSVVIAGTAADLARLWSELLARPDLTQLAGEIDRLYERFTRENLTLFPFTEAVLAELSARGLKLGVATNDAQAGANAHLHSAGIGRHFGFVCGYDSGHGAKPGPGMVLAFATHCGIAPGEVLMVGDSPHDMLAGRAAGAATAAVLSGLAPADTLRGLADQIIGDLRGLPELAATLASTG